MPAKTSIRVERDVQQALRPYIILTALPMVLHMLENNAVRVAFSERKSRALGYYIGPKEEAADAAPRPFPGYVDFKQMHTISLQIDLNPYALLFVFLHEWAHLMTHRQYGDTVSDHGPEWKANFKQIFAPFHREDIFPGDILAVIDDYFVKTSRYFETELDEACRRYGADRKGFARTYLRLLKKGVEIPSPYMGAEAEAIKEAQRAKKEKARETEIKRQLKQWAKEKAAQDKKDEKKVPAVCGTSLLGNLACGALFRFNGTDYRLLSKEAGFATAESVQEKKPLRIHTMVQVEILG